MTNEKSMMLYTSEWNNQKTFRMLPITNDCPFMEVIYDPATTILVVITKIDKDTFQYIPKLDDSGLLMMRKSLTKEQQMNGIKPYKEQRVKVTVKSEHFINEKDEQIDFIELFAVNSKSFEFKKYLRDIDEEANKKILFPEKKPLLNSKGTPIPPVKSRKTE